MCWSRPVTLAFLIAECLAVAVLLMRGAAQRRAVVFLLPLVVQEAIQYHLWVLLEEDEKTMSSTTCSRRNSIVSLVEMHVIVGLPIWWCWRATSAVDAWTSAVATVSGFVPEQSERQGILRHAEDGSHCDDLSWRQHFEQRALRERRALARAQMRSVFFACTFCTLTTASVCLGWWPRFCTTRGLRGGHQLWPWLQPTPPAPVFWFSATAARGLHAVSFGAFVDGTSGFTADDVARGGFAAALGLVYMLLLSNPLHMYRAECAVGEPHAVGWLAVHALVMLGPFFLVPLTFLLHYEIGSVWCWQASAMLILLLIEPQVVRLLSQPACGASCMLPASTLGMGPAAVVHVLRNTEEEPLPGSFLPARQFSGSRPGFVFGSRYHGVGYYRDEGPFREASPAEEELAVRREQTMGDGEWAQAFQAAEHLVSRRQQKGDASAGLEAQRLDTQRGHWQAVAHMMVRMRYL